jgi:hypothetical protein
MILQFLTLLFLLNIAFNVGKFLALYTRITIPQFIFAVILVRYIISGS